MRLEVDDEEQKKALQRVLIYFPVLHNDTQRVDSLSVRSIKPFFIAADNRYVFKRVAVNLQHIGVCPRFNDTVFSFGIRVENFT